MRTGGESRIPAIRIRQSRTKSRQFPHSLSNQRLPGCERLHPFASVCRRLRVLPARCHSNVTREGARAQAVRVKIVRRTRAETTSSSEDALPARITGDPAIFGGKPIIRGHRLAVEHVLGLLAAGDKLEIVLQGYS